MPLNIRGNFGQSLTVPLMSEQAGISVRLSDGGYLSVSPGFGLVAGQAVGVAAGAANVNAGGASIAAAAGSSTGLSVVAATSGAAGATEAVGAAAGLAAASGVGASVAASAGASAGAATAAAVGSSGAANEAAGTAAGAATASAGGASIVARLGISDAVATVSGVGEAVSGGDAYAVGGNSPELVVDFVGDYYRKAGSDSTFAGVLSFSRSSDATRINSSGAVETVTSGNARTGHHVWNGSAWVKAGMLFETQARTNLLLNSGTLSTQSVTVSATAYTLHFTGTGTITLSGASTAGPLVGTGSGENNRVSLTFTPSAGTLTLTVSGTVTNAQLEAGAWRTSYIPTTGSTVTRALDVLTIPAANTAPSTTAISIQMDGRISFVDDDTTSIAAFYDWRVDGSNYIGYGINGSSTRTGRPRGEQRSTASGLDTVEITTGDYTPGIDVTFNIAARHTSSAMNIANLGVAGTANTTMTDLVDLSARDFSFGGPNNKLTAIIGKLRIWEDVDIGNTGIADVSA